MLQWLHLINAETEDDLMVIEQTDIQEIKDAVIKIRELSEDEKAKQAAFQREMDLFEKEMFYSKYNKVKEESEQKDKIIAEKEKNLEVKDKIIEEKDKQIETILSGLVNDGILSVDEAAKRAGITIEEFEKLMNTEA